MVKEGKFTVIRERVDSATALQNVAGMTDDVSVVVEGSVLYPYFGFTARCSVPTMIGKKELTIDCLVDGINGHGATADSFSTEQAVARDEVRLRSKITDDEARRMAQRTVTHRLGKQLKMIAPFDVQLEAAGTVYKRFWIIRIGDGRIMADSVTGNMHPLSASAA
jgi:hypothetical protein